MDPRVFSRIVTLIDPYRGSPSSLSTNLQDSSPHRGSSRRGPVDSQQVTFVSHFCRVPSPSRVRPYTESLVFSRKKMGPRHGMVRKKSSRNQEVHPSSVTYEELWTIVTINFFYIYICLSQHKHSKDFVIQPF